MGVFSLLFFGAAWWFSRKPSKILDYVGKFLNPLFLVLLGLLLVFAFTQPMGTIQEAPVSPLYQVTRLLHRLHKWGQYVGCTSLISLWHQSSATAIRNMGYHETFRNRERYDSFWLYQYLSDGDDLTHCFPTWER